MMEMMERWKNGRKDSVQPFRDTENTTLERKNKD
jgi:hypothetical protein